MTLHKNSGESRESSLIPGHHLRVTISANQGGRRYMEDRVHVHVERNIDKSIDFFYIGVYDGHGGADASEFVRKNLLQNIMKHEKFNTGYEEDMMDAIRDGFLMTHEQMRVVYDSWPNTASGYPSTAGTTCSCVFLRNGKIYTGHVGDSAIFLGRRVPVGTDSVDDRIAAERLTVDHKPECERELERIRTSGGDVAVKSGVTRVIWRRVVKGHHHGPMRRNSPIESIPFLSVARSLGDLWSYCEATREFVVSPDPDVEVRDIDDEDVCIVLASDGLTNVMTPAQVMMVIDEEEKISGAKGTNANHARALLGSALQSWRTLRADNITVAAIMIDRTEVCRNDEDNSHYRIAQFAPVSDVLTRIPDAMVKITPTSSIALRTIRTPIIYSGSKDPNVSKLDYRGPGFRTHEEELLEEQRQIRMQLQAKWGEDEKNLDDEEEEDEEMIETNELQEDDEDIVVSIEPSVNIVRETTRYVVTPTKSKLSPSPAKSKSPIGVALPMRLAVINGNSSEKKKKVEEDLKNSPSSDDTEGTDEEDNSEMNGTPRTKRTKRVAKRRLRAPKMTLAEDVAEKKVTRSASNVSEKRVLRSASRMQESKTPITSTTPTRGRPKKIQTSPVAEPKKIAVVTRSREKTATPQKSTIDLSTPKTTTIIINSKCPTSRKRNRLAFEGQTPVSSYSGVAVGHVGMTPIVAQLSLNDVKPRSAPTTPEKTVPVSRLMNTSKWSLSKLDDMSKNGIEDVKEVVEPPSKMRRVVGWVRRLVGLSTEK